jgi:hypothetical protein
MPTTFGTPSKTIFLKGPEAHKLHEEFEVEGLSHSLTFSAALVTANVINGNVAGVAIPAITFATDSDTTMAAIATAIAGMAGVRDAYVVDAGTSDRVIMVVPDNQTTGIPLTGFVVTAGGSQATVVAADVNKKIFEGMPVEINPTTGRIQPLTAATASTTKIGYAVMDAVYGQYCTVALMGYCITYCKSADALAHGPVAYSSYDAVAGYVKVTDTSVTATNIIGWVIDSTTGADETVRVIMK